VYVFLDNHSTIVYGKIIYSEVLLKYFKEVMEGFGSGCMYKE